MGNYYICQKCLGPIIRNGIVVYKRRGLGYEKKGKTYHKGCFKKIKNYEEGGGRAI